jgi:hypothetical protein
MFIVILHCCYNNRANQYSILFIEDPLFLGDNLSEGFQDCSLSISFDY